MAHNFDSNLSFGEDRSSLTNGFRSLRHPFVVLAHVGFRASAIFFYVFANIFAVSFIIQFLVILTLLSADFWTVKNITGRLLVGLRWWNFVDAEGQNHWKFESSKVRSRPWKVVHERGQFQNPERFDAFERRIFWGALVAAPFMWVLLVSIAFITFKWEWMVVALLGASMTLANLYGYFRCKWSNTQELSNYVTKWAFLSMLTKGAQQAQSQAAGTSGAPTQTV
ncbi:hypothetical protein AAVH_16954 [Aphelenchoides avenae]|nr:hypothetical protein AAVH_16954 [Aphelenchus avenae]